MEKIEKEILEKFYAEHNDNFQGLHVTFDEERIHFDSQSSRFISTIISLAFASGQKDMIEKIKLKIGELNLTIEDEDICAGISIALNEVSKINLTPPREDKE